MNRRMALAGALALLAAGLVPSLSGTADAAAPLLLARQGQLVPGVGLITRIDNIAVNDAGDWLVLADTDADASSDAVLLRGSGLYLREDQSLAAPPGASLASFGSINLSAGGQSGWNLSLRHQPSTADSGIYLDTALLIQEHDLATAPQLSPNTRFSGFVDAKINGSKQIAVLATIDDPLIPTTIDRALVVLDLDGSGQLVSERAVVKEGQLLPGQTQAIADFGTGPHQTAFNDAGQLFYFADLTGIFLTDGVLYLDQTKIAQEGSPSPVAGRNYEILAGTSLDLNNRGEVAFRANLDGSEFADDDIIVEGEELVREGQTLPVISPFQITSLGAPGGSVSIDDDRNVLWFGDWSNPDTQKDTGLWLNDVIVAQEGDSVDGTLLVASFATGPSAYALSRNGRYIVLRVVLEDLTEAALRLEVQAPPPVPDGGRVPGVPMRAARNANGTDVDVAWDVAGCPASRYHLFYGDLSSVASLTYNGAVCDLGATGHATFTPPEGSVFFLIASSDESGVEGVHGYDSRGRARHASAHGLCDVVGQIRSARCDSGQVTSRLESRR